VTQTLKAWQINDRTKYTHTLALKNIWGLYVMIYNIKGIQNQKWE